jgi:hypothetical protein
MDVKEKLAGFLPESDKWKTRGEAIIVDVKRADQYPEPDECKKGRALSPWFKVGLKDLYHRGLEVYLHCPEKLIEDGQGGWRLAKNQKTEDGITAIRVGRIPFEFIERVDEHGDGAYGMPFIYCHFKGSGSQPYEKIVYYQIDGDYLYLVDGFQEPQKSWRRLFRG